MWGEEKFEILLGSCYRASSEQIIESILAEVSAFANGQPQRDDMTLMVMKVHEGCEI
jgi:serine phosphatase RsbU (regulator of sigma subunit)